MGQAGLQPGATAALAFLQPLTYPSLTGAGEVPGLTLQSLGNIDLRPEVTTEFEGGLRFLGLFAGRLNVELTQFRKTSRDQIFTSAAAPVVRRGRHADGVTSRRWSTPAWSWQVDGTVVV